MLTLAAGFWIINWRWCGGAKLVVGDKYGLGVTFGCYWLVRQHGGFGPLGPAFGGLLSI